MNLKNFRILVTATSFGINDPTLRSYLEDCVGEVVYNPTEKPLSSNHLANLLPGIDGLIAGLDVLDENALRSADCLKVISRYGVGVDNVDLDACRFRNIAVTNTPGANSASVAELAIGLMLCLLRKIPKAVSSTRAGEWPRISGLSIEGKTVGIVGFGAIGKALARLLVGFNCRILACDLMPDLELAGQLGVQILPLDQLLSESHIISLHLPLSPNTRQMVDRDFLAKIKPGSFLLNLARGEIIDEDALYESLHSGHLAGAALDAFSQEPPDPNNPIFSMENVLITPHAGAHTDSAINAMGWMSLKDCLAVLSGHDPIYRVV